VAGGSHRLIHELCSFRGLGRRREQWRSFWRDALRRSLGQGALRRSSQRSARQCSSWSVVLHRSSQRDALRISLTHELLSEFRCSLGREALQCSLTRDVLGCSSGQDALGCSLGRREALQCSLTRDDLGCSFRREALRRNALGALCPITPSFLSDKAAPRRAMLSKYAPMRFLISCKTRTTKSGSRLTQSFSANDIGGSLTAASPTARRLVLAAGPEIPVHTAIRGPGGGGRRRRPKQRSRRRRSRAVSAERTGAPLRRPWPCGSRREREVAE
jgi:hypothetical protein